MTEKVIEPRLGPYGGDAVAEPTDIVPDEERRGLKYALWGFLATLAVVLLITLPPGAPLRNPETGDIFGDSPFMTSILVIISAAVPASRAMPTARAPARSPAASRPSTRSSKTYSGLAGLIFLLLMIAQFIAFFNYTQHRDRAGREPRRRRSSTPGSGPSRCSSGSSLVTALLDIIIPGVIPKWAIFAPIFIPLFLRLGIAPQLVLAAYRVGDSPFNVITPLMAYFAVIVVFAQRYDKQAGVGTIVSLMIPYSDRDPPRLDRLPGGLVPDRDPARTGSARAPDVIRAVDRSAAPGRGVSDVAITFAILFAVVLAVRLEPVPGGVVAIGAALALYFSGVLDLTQALAGFGDPAVIFIATLFVVSEGLDASGVTTWAGQELIARVGDSRTRLDRR